MKNVAREATNGVIYGESGEIVKNGLRVVCPRCGEIGLYPGHGGSVNIWTVGAIERRECTKCRKLLAVQTPPLRGRIRDFPERRCAP